MFFYDIICCYKLLIERSSRMSKENSPVPSGLSSGLESVVVLFLVSLIVPAFHHKYDLGKPSSYLCYGCLVAAFRSFMYILRRKAVTTCKINPEYLSNNAVMEVAYAYTHMILLLMIFKTVVFGWAAFFLAEHLQYQLQVALISFVFDLHIIFQLVTQQSAERRQHDSVIVHQQLLAPFSIQCSLIAAGAFCMYQNGSFYITFLRNIIPAYIS